MIYEMQELPGEKTVYVVLTSLWRAIAYDVVADVRLTIARPRHDRNRWGHDHRLNPDRCRQ